MDFNNTIGLKKDADFRKIYKHGKSFANKYLVVYILKNNLNINRVGFSVSKKVGKSIIRNRVRRLLKESYRLSCDENIEVGYDLIFIARIPSNESDYKTIHKAMINVIKKTKITSTL